jgi:hypothetical protein
MLRDIVWKGLPGAGNTARKNEQTEQEIWSFHKNKIKDFVLY